MTQPSNLEIVKQIEQDLKEGNLSAILEFLAEDVVWIVPGSTDYPFKGEYHGRNKLKEVFELAGKIIDMKESEATDYISLDDKNQVLVFGNERGSLKPGGNAFKHNWVEVFTLRDGKVVRLHSYID